MWHLRDSIGSLLASKVLVCPGRKQVDNKNIRSTPTHGIEKILRWSERQGCTHSWIVFSVWNLTRKCVQCGQLMEEKGHGLVCGFQSSKAPVPPGTVTDLTHCLSSFDLLVTWKLIVTWYQWYNLFEILCLYIFLKPWARNIYRWIRISPGHWEKLQDKAVFSVSLYTQCQV